MCVGFGACEKESDFKCQTQTKSYSSGTHNQGFINSAVFSDCAYDSFILNYK